MLLLIVIVIVILVLYLDDRNPNNGNANKDEYKDPTHYQKLSVTRPAIITMTITINITITRILTITTPTRTGTKIWSTTNSSSVSLDLRWYRTNTPLKCPTCCGSWGRCPWWRWWRRSWRWRWGRTSGPPASLPSWRLASQPVSSPSSRWTSKPNSVYISTMIFYRHQLGDKLDKGDIGATGSTLTDCFTEVGVCTCHLQ